MAELPSGSVCTQSFVRIGRPWLHTEAFNLATGVTPSALGTAMWDHASGSAFLAPGAGGGGLIVLVPQLVDDLELFEALGERFRTAAQREINPELQLQSCHPSAAAPAQRSPVPLYQLFVDSPELVVVG